MAFAMLMLVLSLTCFTHASTSEQDNIGLVELPLPIPSSTTIKLHTLDQQVLRPRQASFPARHTLRPSSRTTLRPPPRKSPSRPLLKSWPKSDLARPPPRPSFPTADPRLGGSASDWDLEFCKAMSAETFMLMMKASTELNLWPLSNLGNFHIGNLVRGKSQEQIRALLQIGWADIPSNTGTFFVQQASASPSMTVSRGKLLQTE
ncbi:hypothetical protein BCR44DRAFT_1463380 [Catenaria anguillulae PL171]|uniref:Uncharacterized protein n=1 Tax=Catenaria anguillulae PL171 TaxID=765915 RepID=A0A1Y2HC47_9FUNG|nr:hypothetical protein BCR44DRAFT_1463380 [Catenaria anguillulae PL171]